MGRRSYGQYCALAKTLDLVGERWTLLIVRDLALGPKRYADLLEGLPGIGTSLLATRLKHLEAVGIAARSRLPPPAASTVYTLTTDGVALVHALVPLVAWGAPRLLGRRRRGETFRAEWPLLVLAAGVDREAAARVRDVYEFELDGSFAHLRVDNHDVAVVPGPADRPDVTVRIDVPDFVAIGSGELRIADALADGRLHLDGDPGAIERFFRVFRLGAMIDNG